MKVLVTGSNGFLGAAVVERLLVRGATQVRCLVRSGSNLARLDALKKRYPESQFEIFVGNLASVEAADEVIGDAELIYHVAATVGGAPAAMFLGTVVHSRNLLDALVARTVCPRVVLVSSFGVYGVSDLKAGATVDESTPLERVPSDRDVYSHTKLRQEELFWEYQKKHDFWLSILRPGVIYGPGGGAMSARVGLKLFGVFLKLGGKNLMPLSFVDNCAEAVVLAGEKDGAKGEVYNVHDDDLPTCDAFLKRYRGEVEQLHVLPIPYRALMAGSRLVRWYSQYSQGQLPAIFTPYKTKATWKGHRFCNAKLKSLGWQQLVSTEDGLRRHFDALRQT